MEEISIALIGFLGLLLSLWIISKIFHFQKKNFITAFKVAFIVSIISFIIRSISLIFSLKDYQKPPINIIAMITEIVVLLILIQKFYNIKWPKSIFILIITYFGKMAIAGIITLIIVLQFTTTMQDINKEEIKIDIGNFESIKVDNYNFIFKSDIKFSHKMENITIKDLKCMVNSALLFPSGLKDQDNIYTFESFDYKGLDLKVKGSAYFECDSACINNKAIMNTGSPKGTKIIFIEGGEKVTVNFNFNIKGNKPLTIGCTPIFNSQIPNITTPWYKNLFSINYIID